MVTLQTSVIKSFELFPGKIKLFFHFILLITKWFIFIDINILAINTYKGNKRAFSINPRGGYQEVNFEFGVNTEVAGSCSLQWKNINYVFGGYNKGQQVSMMNGNQLERKGKLDFDFHDGGCTVLNQITIVLCFNYAEKKVCRQSNNPLGSFTKLPNSNYDHKRIRIASFDGKNTIY